jgi:5-oxoprolinase (ATP-hydrolysing)
LEEKARNVLKEQGNYSSIEIIQYLNMRYHGTDFSIMINITGKNDGSLLGGDYQLEFERRYKREYGFTIAGRDILVDDLRVRAIGKSDTFSVEEKIDANEKYEPITHSETYFKELGRTKVPVYDLNHLPAGAVIRGPCIIIYSTTTIAVTPNSSAKITNNGNVMLTFAHDTKKTVGTKLDGVQLTIFSHRFMSIAEQMGRTLQRTSISTNIKERLDFSCAIFSVSNLL